MGGIMKVDRDDIEKVIALFDEEDKTYINLDYLLDNKIIEVNDEKEDKQDMVLKLGDNDAG